MYFDDHNPPHFHAKYGVHEALIAINDFTVIGGSFPSRALTLVIEWASQHKDELIKDWNLVKNFKLPYPIEPLK